MPNRYPLTPKPSLLKPEPYTLSPQPSNSNPQPLNSNPQSSNSADGIDGVFGSSAGSLVGAYFVGNQQGMPQYGCSVYYDLLTDDLVSPPEWYKSRQFWVTSTTCGINEGDWKRRFGPRACAFLPSPDRLRRLWGNSRGCPSMAARCSTIS